MEQEQRMAQGMKITQTASQGGMSGMGMYSQQAYNQTYNQNNTAMRQIYAGEVEHLTRIEKIRDSLTKKLERQSKLQEEMRSQGKDIAAFEEKRAITAERLVRASEATNRQQQLLLGSSKLLRGNLGGNSDTYGPAPYEAYGPPSPSTPPPGGGSPGMGFLGKLVSAAGVVAAVRGAQQLAEDYVRRPMDVLHAQGSAVAGTTGRTLSQMQSGEFAYEGMFSEERAKAAKVAETAERRSRGWDIGQVAMGGALMVGGGIAAATGFGAIPGVTAMTMGAGMLFNKRSMLDRERYNAEKEAQYSENFGSALQSEKDMAPFKKDAIEKYQKSGAGYLASQRSLGLSDRQLFSFLNNGAQSGFGDQMLLQSSSAILGAGGSTAMGRNSEMALKAERGLNLSNSAQILGQLSGTQGIPETSKKSLIDIFSVAQTIGLDNSKFAEENRKFMQSVSESVNKGGTTSEGSAETIARIMGSFTGGSTTMRGLDAGRSAYESYQGAASATSGYQGALNISGLMSSDPRFKKLNDPAALQGLLELKPNEIDENDIGIRDAASKMGMSSKELAGILLKQKSQSVSKGLMRPEVMSKISAAQEKWKAGHGGSLAGFESSDELVGTGISGVLGMADKNLDRQGKLKSILGLADLSNPLSDNAKAKADAAYNIENKDTGRAGDKIIQAAALNAQTSLETLSRSIDKFASDAIAAAGRMGGTVVPNARSADAAFQEAQTEQTRAQAEYNKYHSGLPHMMSKAESDAENAALRALRTANGNLSRTQQSATAANKATTK